LDKIFKALSDPTRRKILKLLENKEMNAGEIAQHFQISKPSISNHLNILKHAGLIADNRNGQNIIYSLKNKALDEVVNWFVEFINK
jgi:DNA-binding transcriptional ArsR family regulator